MSTPSVAALPPNMMDPKASISKGEGTSKEDTIGSRANIGEPVARRQWRINLKEKS